MSRTAETSPSPASRRRDTSFYGQGPDDRLIKLHEVMSLTGYCRTTIYTKVKTRDFPAPVKLGATSGSRWPLGEIRKFNADAIAARDRQREPAAPRGRASSDRLSA
jgi:prophage regulatory protein